MNEPNPQNTAAPASGTTAGPSSEERKWATFAHLSALIGALLTSGWGGSIGFFVGPLIIWLMKREEMPFVNDQAKEALNFTITVSIACFVLLLLTIISLGIGALVTVPLFMIIGIGALVLVVIAAIKANEGVAYRYPVTLRLVK
jgi:uncharacterized Tic20 family protein